MQKNIRKMVYYILKVLLCCYSVLCNCNTRAPSPTCLFTEKLNNNFLPTLANGYIGTVALSDEIHVGGLYNGKANTIPDFLSKQRKNRVKGSTNHTHRARIPSTAAIQYRLNGIGQSSFALDIQSNVFYKWFDSKNANVEQRIYAHSELKNVIVNEIIIKANRNLVLYFEKNEGKESEDIVFKNVKVKKASAFKAKIGQIKEAEIKNGTKTKVAVIFSKVPKSVKIIKNSVKEFKFITSIVTSLESLKLLPDAMMYWKKAQNMGKDLFRTHQKKWAQTFESFHIEITGNLFLSQTVNSALSSLLSSVRSDWEYGISPGGIAPSKEYLGHVFWDQDIWMAPAFLMFYPELAKSFLEYRYKRLNAAIDIAKKYNFKGAMFPWESAVSGFEVCPEERYGRNEIHITGDIVFSIRQYLYATGDFDWVFHHGIQVVFSAAEFWISRVSYNNSLNLYVINDVMPPDEYQYPVKNSVYTNVIAKMCLEFAVELGKIFKIKTSFDWENVATKMYIPFDKTLKFHPEFDGFDIKNPLSVVKQADVILINFPLMFPMDRDVKKNDLLLYENITDLNGPAMTQSMFTIGWLEVGNRVAAEKAFKKNFEHIQEPFKVWTEIRNGDGAKNFLTGAGGFLQTIIFGFGGIRVHNFSLDFNLSLLPESTSLLIYGVKYRDNSLIFNVNKDNKCFIELSHASKTQLICLMNGKKIPLKTGLKVLTCRGSIVPSNSIYDVNNNDTNYILENIVV
ncbi:protein-glucosylgalactosylhydroxylysine glucosidase [Hydra vulgaris]|uniref:protein-glucosylgalactosylhydroxylysine glucosidase n=1 Tax=Hydra vulgaris TaxID=6087 RepID=UPI001F5F7439|nr:protein-glucosylgalactosylhydroxylysine glucosidase [Hydra vulgaris]